MPKLSPAPTVVSGLKQALVPHAPFSGMSSGDLERVVSASKLRYFTPGETILVPTDGRPSQCFVIKQGVRYATPLFLVLILVEISDVIFAVDSIPAIFAITTDPFIVLTSNIFAIMGLRAMYFLLADFADRFVLLKYGLALILLFIGTKMLLIDIYKIPIAVSLGVVAVILIGSMLLSLRYSRKSPSA